MAASAHEPCVQVHLRIHILEWFPPPNLVWLTFIHVKDPSCLQGTLYGQHESVNRERKERYREFVVWNLNENCWEIVWCVCISTYKEKKKKKKKRWGEELGHVWPEERRKKKEERRKKKKKEEEEEEGFLCLCLSVLSPSKSRKRTSRPAFLLPLPSSTLPLHGFSVARTLFAFIPALSRQWPWVFFVFVCFFCACHCPSTQNSDRDDGEH